MTQVRVLEGLCEGKIHIATEPIVEEKPDSAEA